MNYYLSWLFFVSQVPPPSQAILLLWLGREDSWFGLLSAFCVEGVRSEKVYQPLNYIFFVCSLFEFNPENISVYINIFKTFFVETGNISMSAYLLVRHRPPPQKLLRWFLTFFVCKSSRNKLINSTEGKWIVGESSDGWGKQPGAVSKISWLTLWMNAPLRYNESIEHCGSRGLWM